MSKSVTCKSLHGRRAIPTRSQQRCLWEEARRGPAYSKIVSDSTDYGLNRPLTLNSSVSKSNWGFAWDCLQLGLTRHRKAYEFYVTTHQTCNTLICLYCWAFRLHKICRSLSIRRVLRATSSTISIRFMIHIYIEYDIRIMISNLVRSKIKSTFDNWDLFNKDINFLVWDLIIKIYNIKNQNFKEKVWNVVV